MARKNDLISIYTKTVDEIKEAGLFKGEAPICSPQGAKVTLEDGKEYLNMCANNYLGLGNNQRLIDAAKRTYDERGFGVASVRFICGTQDIHKQLEKKISDFLGTDDTILYSSCFDAKRWAFFALSLKAEDAVISDERKPRFYYRRRASLQSKEIPLQKQQHGRSGSKLKEADEARARIKLDR